MSEQHHFVIVRTRVGALHAELLDVESYSEQLGLVDESALQKQARKLCEDVIAVQSGDCVAYGIVHAANINEARASVERIAWMGSIYFNDSNS